MIDLEHEARDGIDSLPFRSGAEAPSSLALFTSRHLSFYADWVAPSRGFPWLSSPMEYGTLLTAASMAA